MDLHLYNWAEILSAVICSICFFYKPLVLNRSFVWFLWLTVLVELTAINFNFNKQYGFKNFTYNIFTAIEFIFYLNILRNFNSKTSTKRTLRIFSYLILLFYVVNITIGQGFTSYNSYSQTIGSLLIIATCLLFFYEITNPESDVLSISRWSLVPIVSGLLLFYAGNLLNLILFVYTRDHYPKTFMYLNRLVNNNLNIVLYSCFAISFIIEIKNKNKFYTGIETIKINETEYQFVDEER